MPYSKSEKLHEVLLLKKVNYELCCERKNMDRGLIQHIGVASDGNRIWYHIEKLGLVMEVDSGTGRIKCIFENPEYGFGVTHRMICYYNEKLYLIPNCSGNLYEYDISNNSTKRIELSKKRNCRMTGGVGAGHYLFLFGSEPEIVRFNTETNEINSIQLNAMELGMQHEPDTWFWTESVIMNNRTGILMCDTNEIVFLDEDIKVAYSALGNKMEIWPLHSICVEGDSIHAIHVENKEIIVCGVYDLNGRIKNRTEIKYNNSYAIYPFVHAEHIKNEWLLLPFKSNNICTLNEDTKELAVIHELDIDDQLLARDGVYIFNSGIKLSDGKIAAIDQARGVLVTIDPRSLAITEKKLHFDAETEESLRCLFNNRLLLGTGVVYERAIVSELRNLVDVVLMK